MGLDGGVLGKHVAGLRRRRQPEFAGRERLDPEASQEFADFAQLAGIVGGDDDSAGE